MPTTVRTQTLWVCVLLRRAVVALLLATVFPLPGPAAVAPDGQLLPPPAPAPVTPAEDLVPAIPKPPRPPSTDWSQWNGVERFRESYQSRRTRERNFGSSANALSEISIANATFELPQAMDDPDHLRAEALVERFNFGGWSDPPVAMELADGRTNTTTR